PIGTVGTGKGAFQRGALTQADARQLAYEDEIRSREGLQLPTVEQAFTDARAQDLPDELQDESAGMRALGDDTVPAPWGMAEEQAATSGRDDPTVQVRRALYAGEAERRGLADEDVQETVPAGEDIELPFDPADPIRAIEPDRIPTRQNTRRPADPIRAEA